MSVPYHPMVAHLPIAFAIFAPFLSLVLLVLIHRRRLSFRNWALASLWQLLLTGSVYAAMLTGEWEEERVEEFLQEQAVEAVLAAEQTEAVLAAEQALEALERHEQSAESLFYASLISLLIAFAALRSGKIGLLFRSAALLSQLILLALIIRTAHLGGELVYIHGAASAYADGSGAGKGAENTEREER